MFPNKAKYVQMYKSYKKQKSDRSCPESAEHFDTQTTNMA